MSSLQKFILVTLLAPATRTLTLSEFNRYVYIKRYNVKHPTDAQRACLSRSYRRLQAQHLITRNRKADMWRLTTVHPSGEMAARFELLDHPEKYPHLTNSRPAPSASA